MPDPNETEVPAGWAEEETSESPSVVEELEAALEEQAAPIVEGDPAQLQGKYPGDHHPPTDEEIFAATRNPPEPLTPAQQKAKDEGKDRIRRRERVKEIGIDPRQREGLVPLWEKLETIETMLEQLLAAREAAPAPKEE